MSTSFVVSVRPRVRHVRVRSRVSRATTTQGQDFTTTCPCADITKPENSIYSEHPNSCATPEFSTRPPTRDKPSATRHDMLHRQAATPRTGP